MDEPASPEIISVEDWIHAAYRGDAAFVLDRLRRGIDVDARGPREDTALIAAAHGGRVDVIRILLEHGADPNMDCELGCTAVTFGVFRLRPQDWSPSDPRPSDPRPLELLLAAGGHYRLCEAVLLNDLELARTRLDEGADPNFETHYGTLLMLAAERGYAKFVELLLDHGADIRQLDYIGHTALTKAAGRGRTEVARILLDRGAAETRDSALEAAAFEGHRETAEMLIARGARRSVVDAVALNDISLLETMLDEELGRDLSGGFIREVGRLAMLAARVAEPMVVALLLDRGAAHVKENDDHSLLAEAARHGRLDTIRLLLDRGADVHAVGRSGATPLQWAVHEGRDEAADLLRRAGAVR
jgi:ankyrin repeat protein